MKRKEWSFGVVAAVAAVGLAAGSGTAFAADNGIPAGKAEHSVWQLDVTGTYKVAGQVPTNQREERWVAPDRGRSLVTDTANGKIASEFLQDTTGLFAYNGLIDTVFTSPPQPEWLAISSNKVETDFQRYQLDRGRVEKAGLTTFRGQTVLRLVSPGDVSGDEPGDKVRIDNLVDPDTLAPIRKITDVTTPGGKTLHQVFTRTSFEVVDEASLPADTFVFGEHPGAQQRGGPGATGANAKPKVKAKHKAKNKHKVKAKHRKAAARR